jgi:hypothetical protein
MRIGLVTEIVSIPFLSIVFDTITFSLDKIVISDCCNNNRDLFYVIAFFCTNSQEKSTQHAGARHCSSYQQIVIMRPLEMRKFKCLE